MRGLVRFLVTLATPFILIFGGAGLFGLGVEHEINVLIWTGGLAFVAGVLWVLWVAFINGDSLFS